MADKKQNKRNNKNNVANSSPEFEVTSDDDLPF